LLHALDELEDACVNAREWLTQTIQAIRSEQYTPDEALRDSIALSFPETSVVHSVLVALGALASFTDSNLHPFGGAVFRRSENLKRDSCSFVFIRGLKSFFKESALRAASSYRA
jgi:hypothetical protein